MYATTSELAGCSTITSQDWRHGAIAESQNDGKALNGKPEIGRFDLARSAQQIPLTLIRQEKYEHRQVCLMLCLNSFNTLNCCAASGNNETVWFTSNTSWHDRSQLLRMVHEACPAG